MERLNFVINLFTISQSEVELAAENEELKKQVSELQNYIIQLQQNLNQTHVPLQKLLRRHMNQYDCSRNTSYP